MTAPLQEWLDCHFKCTVYNGKSLQSMFGESCGGYALMYLIDHAEGNRMNDLLNIFRKKDYVSNDHKVGQMLKHLIVDELAWCKICKTRCHQDTSGSSRGVHHLLN